MSKFEMFCKKYNDEIVVVGICFGVAITILSVAQAKEISTLRSIWAKNDKAYFKLMGEKEFLARVIGKFL